MSLENNMNKNSSEAPIKSQAEKSAELLNQKIKILEAQLEKTTDDNEKLALIEKLEVAVTEQAKNSEGNVEQQVQILSNAEKKINEVTDKLVKSGKLDKAKIRLIGLGFAALSLVGGGAGLSKMMSPDVVQVEAAPQTVVQPVAEDEPKSVEVHLPGDSNTYTVSTQEQNYENAWGQKFTTELAFKNIDKNNNGLAETEEYIEYNDIHDDGVDNDSATE
jgi:hypothetical protein